MAVQKTFELSKEEWAYVDTRVSEGMFLNRGEFVRWLIRDEAVRQGFLSPAMAATRKARKRKKR